MKKNQKNKFMSLAIKLARNGECNVHPNPMVGCVIVRNGKIIAKGWHECFGGPHAEINALKQAGSKAKGADLYVTLEPCSHFGKTPPCTKAIIKAGIRKVFIGCLDPNKKINGVRELKKHGIEVEYGILKNQTQKLIKRFVCTLKPAKPYVVLKAAMTLDGKIASRTGDSKWITTRKSRNYVHKLRSKFDAILVGANTVIKDNPVLSSHGMGKNPVRVIIDPNLRIPQSSNIYDGKIPTIIIHNLNKVKVSLKLNNVIFTRISNINNNKFNFQYIVKHLESYCLNKILIEGGGETAAQALNDKAVNEVIFFIAPKLLGGRDAKTPVEGLGIAKIADTIKIRDMKVSKIGEDIVVRGLVK